MTHVASEELAKEYERGVLDGKDEVNEDAYVNGWNDGHGEGYEVGFDAANETRAEGIYNDLTRLGVPILDGACIRWDAAERCLVVWTLDGREVRFK